MTPIPELMPLWPLWAAFAVLVLAAAGVAWSACAAGGRPAPLRADLETGAGGLVLDEWEGTWAEAPEKARTMMGHTAPPRHVVITYHPDDHLNAAALPLVPWLPPATWREAEEVPVGRVRLTVEAGT